MGRETTAPDSARQRQQYDYMYDVSPPRRTVHPGGSGEARVGCGVVRAFARSTPDVRWTHTWRRGHVHVGPIRYDVYSLQGGVRRPYTF